MGLLSQWTNPSQNNGGLLGRLTGYLRNRSAGTNSKGANDLSTSPTGSDSMGTMSDGTASAKKGGKVAKTGYIKAHKGERILNKKQTQKYAKHAAKSASGKRV